MAAIASQGLQAGVQLLGHLIAIFGRGSLSVQQQVGIAHSQDSVLKAPSKEVDWMRLALEEANKSSTLVLVLILVQIVVSDGE